MIQKPWRKTFFSRGFEYPFQDNLFILCPMCSLEILPTYLLPAYDVWWKGNIFSWGGRVKGMLGFSVADPGFYKNIYIYIFVQEILQNRETSGFSQEEEIQEEFERSYSCDLFKAEQCKYSAGKQTAIRKWRRIYHIKGSWYAESPNFNPRRQYIWLHRNSEKTR